MENKNVVVLGAKPSFKARAKKAAAKVATVVTGSLASASAFAQASDMPTDLEAAAGFMTTKGGIAIAVAAAITLITLGVTAAKLPRKGS